MEKKRNRICVTAGIQEIRMEANRFHDAIRMQN